jgi:ribonuclease HII
VLSCGVQFLGERPALAGWLTLGAASEPAGLRWPFAIDSHVTDRSLHMTYLIGTDEAGYGPNLGPLVISASVWQVPDAACGDNLYERLGHVVSASLDSRRDGRRLTIADSKTLYKPGGTLAALERGVLVALGITGRAATRWRDVWPALDSDNVAHLDSLPWHVDYDGAIPCDAEADEIENDRRFLQDGLDKSDVTLHAIRSAAVFPQQFNELVEQHGNKAAALSTQTLSLVAQLLAPLPEAPVVIICDKHGGRNKYGPLLQQTFPEYLVEVHRETAAESIYRWGPASRRVEIRFVVKGERYLPAALASMASKYLRELAMQAFNDFWRRHLPDLKPTAGYPTDARRFKTEIQAVQQRLGVDDRILWRNR